MQPMLALLLIILQLVCGALSNFGCQASPHSLNMSMQLGQSVGHAYSKLQENSAERAQQVCTSLQAKS